MASPFKVPLNALRAIEIVARGGTLGHAAEELGVTVGAVSQHIRRAEERLGLRLFERTPKGLEPTAVLERALPMLEAGFRSLAEGAAAIEAEERCVLTITTAPAFAARWLVQRLVRFTRAHPEIELRFVATTDVIDLARSDIDCAIRLGRGRWPGVEAEMLMPQRMFPVATPALAERLAAPADLASVPVVTDAGSMIDWADWFAAAGVPQPAMSGPSFTDPSLAFEAALSGQGVMLAWQMLAADALADGRLVRPFPETAPTELAYWFVVTPTKARNRKVQQFKAWLVSEMAASAEVG